LIKEGEKLAMKELKTNNIVKKLRETEQENAKTIKQQRFCAHILRKNDLNLLFFKVKNLTK